VCFQKCSASLNKIILFAFLVVSRGSRDDASNIEDSELCSPNAVSVMEREAIWRVSLAGARGCHVPQAAPAVAYHSILPAPSALLRLRCGYHLIHYVPSIPSTSCLYAVRSAHNLLSIDLSCASACLPSSRPLLGMSIYSMCSLINILHAPLSS
jgi:hypothetical protein